MHVSDARIEANRKNAKRSKGPTSELGKSISRRNSIKHGMTGEGIVLSEGDQAEIERRVDAFHDELQPQSDVGSVLIRRMALLSVRSERSAEQENAEIAERVRNAVHVFDEDRARHVENLFARGPSDPRGNLRNLRRMPEGVDRLIETWRRLARELGLEHGWSNVQTERAASMLGLTPSQLEATRIGQLSHATWGNFFYLTPEEGGDLKEHPRREWARVELRKEIEAQIAELEAHRTTLDFDRIAQSRREAPLRVGFDDSKPAILARRYEAEADRGFYKALKEFRQVEAEAQARNEEEPEVSESDRPESKVGSSRGMGPAMVIERTTTLPPAPKVENRATRRANQAVSRGKRPSSPPA